MGAPKESLDDTLLMSNQNMLLWRIGENYPRIIIKYTSQTSTLQLYAIFLQLLDLQLNDSNFRRYVLVQFLILFQYINAPVKFKRYVVLSKILVVALLLVYKGEIEV